MIKSQSTAAVYGVYAAALRNNVDWIIVKSICDWADGRKRARKVYRQNLAARNAALAVLLTLERGGFSWVRLF
jgi:nucleoside phosphorylase